MPDVDFKQDYHSLSQEIEIIIEMAFRTQISSLKKKELQAPEMEMEDPYRKYN